jgi:HEPN domain-containing protein
MVNRRRVDALLEMADEDLTGARALLGISTRLARYHVQQSAEKAVKALLELRGLNPGREHRFESLAEMFPMKINGMHEFKASIRFHQPSHRFVTQLPRGGSWRRLHANSSTKRLAQWSRSFMM